MPRKPVFALLLFSWLSAAAAVLAADIAADTAAGPASDEQPAAKRVNRAPIPIEDQPGSRRGLDQGPKYWKEALIPIADQPGLPRVLLIGDSVSVGYTVFTRELLKGEANVHRIPENGGPTGKALEKIDGWLGDGHWDVIHFNWGLHDLRQSVGTNLEQYEQNLRKLVKRLQATGAKLIWCSTTPLPEDVPRSALQTDDLVARNAVAKKLMDENGIAIDDLYTFAKPRLAKIQMPKSAHFTEQGSRVLAQQVASAIREALKGPAPLEPTLGKKGRLLLEEKFDGDTLPKGWSVKSGGVRVAGGTLHASQKKERDGRLCLFNCAQPMQDAAIQIDFKFGGKGGLNVSVNPSPGELKKHGHLFSVMITRTMWNITEHNDKSDPNSRSRALASAPEKFEPGQWYTLLLETKGDDVVARVEGKRALCASSKDFRVKKPGIEFRVAGRDNEEVSFDNLRVWELK